VIAVAGSSKLGVSGMSTETRAKVDASASAQCCAGPVTVESGTSAAEREQPKAGGSKVDGVVQRGGFPERPKLCTASTVA
jgi:hypothetical protein